MMISALHLMDRCMTTLREMRDTGNIVEVHKVIIELESAGEILIHHIAKRGCMGCAPQGRVLNDKN